MGEVLFHGQATNWPPLPAIAIPEVHTRPVETEELVLDLRRPSKLSPLWWERSLADALAGLSSFRTSRLRVIRVLMFAVMGK